MKFKTEVNNAVPVPLILESYDYFLTVENGMHYVYQFIQDEHENIIVLSVPKGKSIQNFHNAFPNYNLFLNAYKQTVTSMYKLILESYDKKTQTLKFTKDGKFF